MPLAGRAAWAAFAVIASLAPASRTASARAVDHPGSDGAASAPRGARARAPQHDAPHVLARHPDDGAAHRAASGAKETQNVSGALPSRHAGVRPSNGPERHGGGAHSSKHALPPPRPLRAIRATPANASWRPYHKPPWQRGFVSLFGHGKKWSGYLVDKYGDVIPAARKSLSGVLASWRTGKQMLIDERLLALVADVSDELGGRPIRIVSGYREHSYAPDSRHKTGEAFDFSVPGVPNEAVRDLLRSLPDVGVGYYPNSTHVHLDVRDKPTYWVDYSRPGDEPLYAWDRRVTGLTPAQRALAAALDSISQHARDERATAEPEPQHAKEEAHSRAHADPLPSRAAATPAARGGSASLPDAEGAEDEHEGDSGEPAALPAVHATSPTLSPTEPAASRVSVAQGASDASVADRR